eukprot:366494-Chlamydomonas_euryale.AAC.10
MLYSAGLTWTVAKNRLTQWHVPWRGRSQSQSYRERTHEEHACIERSMAKGINQRAGRCHKGHAIAFSPEPPHTHPNLRTGRENRAQSR